MDQNSKDILDTVVFIKERMATKDDVREIVREELKTTNDRLSAVESKIEGTNRRLDSEAMHRTDLKLPRRLHDVEEKLFGIGSSKHPKHVRSRPRLGGNR